MSLNSHSAAHLPQSLAACLRICQFEHSEKKVTFVRIDAISDSTGPARRGSSACLDGEMPLRKSRSMSATFQGRAALEDLLEAI